VKRLILCLSLAAIILASALGSACSPAPVNVQGYETQSGYMQPDHGYFYYWLMYHATVGVYQPRVSYHVYVPPSGYPTTYRPWYSRPSVPSYAPSYTRPYGAQTPARTSGGFSGLPSYSPPAVAPRGTQTPARTSGGFSSYAPRPSAPAAPRASGGFSAPRPSTSMPSRTSGGFSSGRRR
jgi:hypothetical protein